MFCDIFLAHLLGADWLHVASGISSEGLYEHGARVRLEEGDVVFDCGANMGMFSALAAKKGCRALAFEPSSYIRDAYTGRNAALNGGFEVYPYALSEKRETLRFFLDRDNIGSSMRADAAGGAPKPEDVETVEALGIDDFVEQHGLDRVDFIKADIEGSERLMLRGARRVLREFSPKLSICTYHLPDDPDVLAKIILESQPRYTIVQGDFKLYAHV